MLNYSNSSFSSLIFTICHEYVEKYSPVHFEITPLETCGSLVLRAYKSIPAVIRATPTVVPGLNSI